MLHFPKTFPGPDAELQAEKAKTAGTYRIDAVLYQLKADFKSKCYICEDAPQSINVEHFVSHKENLDLKFSWANLFWACAHCNNIKGSRFDGMLDCTVDADIEMKLEYVFSVFPMEKVVINDLLGSKRSRLTTLLLLDVFNGTTTMKKIESSELRKKIARQLLELSSYMVEFEEAEDNPEAQADIGRKIKAKLHDSSRFVSFSRAYLRCKTLTLQKLREKVSGFPI